MIVLLGILEFDPAYQAEMERLFKEENVPHAESKKGFIRARAFRSLDSPGRMILMGEWESMEEAHAYYYSQEHDEVTAKYAHYIAGRPHPSWQGEVIEG